MSAAKKQDERTPLTERELDRLSELLLEKLVRRLAKVAAAPPPVVSTDDYKPTAADFEEYNAYLKRRGRQND